MLFRLATNLVILLMCAAGSAWAGGPVPPPGPIASPACSGGNSTLGFTSYGAPLVCGTALASGAIANGVAQLGVYIGANTIGPLTGVNNGILTFSNTGVPTPSITLPSGLTIPGFAPLNSPVFTGSPVAPTPLTANSSTALATTAYVKAQSFVAGAGGQIQYNNGGVFGGFTAGGDVTFAVPNFQVTGLNGWPLGFTRPNSGSLLIGTGALWDSQTPSGALTLSSSGVFSLVPTAVTPGSYTNLNATIGADGRITAAASGQGGGGVPGGAPGQIQINSSGSFGGLAAGSSLTTANGTIDVAASGITSTMLAMGAAAANIGAPTGDLSGPLPGSTVRAINGTPLGSTDPTSGKVLIGDGTRWSSQTIGGDVSLSFNGVATTSIATGSITGSKLASGAASTNIGNTGGDLVGPMPNPKVIALQGRSLSANAPNVGDSYVYSGSTWVPTPAPITGINQLTGSVTAGPGPGIQTATIAPTGVVSGAYQVGSDCWTIASSGQITNIATSTSCIAAPSLTADNGSTILTADDGITTLTSL